MTAAALVSDLHFVAVGVRPPCTHHAHARTHTNTQAIESQSTESGNASTVVVAQILSEAGEFENAEVVLRQSQHGDEGMEIECIADLQGKLDLGEPSALRSAEISLHCAEILNKWAAGNA